MHRDNRKDVQDLPLSREQLDDLVGGMSLAIAERRGSTASADSRHDQWIDVLSVDWGTHKPGGGETGTPGLAGEIRVDG